jgi:hypothetical protein
MHKREMRQEAESLLNQPPSEVPGPDVENENFRDADRKLPEAAVSSGSKPSSIN